MDFSKVALCLKKLGYQKLTEIQKKSLLEVYGGNKSSLVIVAPTGSGKTEAAVFPVMLKITSQRKQPISAIYITPLRALNRDIERRLKNIGECFGLNVAVRHGDTPSAVRKTITQSPPHILITTPETFNYVIINDELRVYLKNLDYIIIDEYRDLLESKRGLLLLTAIYLLETYLNKSFVKIALTATLQDDETALKLLSYNRVGDSGVIKDPAFRELELHISVPICATTLCREINNLINDESLSARLEKIFEKAKEYRYILLFTNTRSLAESLSALLRKLSEDLKIDIQIDVHHGSLSRQHRERVEREFRDRKLNMIVSTSSLELGIDIGHVEYVIQYMSPRQVTRLIQRVGRSRHRLGETSRGLVITMNNLLHTLEALVIAMRGLEGLLEKEQILVNSLDVLAYAIALYVYLHPGGIQINKLYEVIKENPLYNSLSFEELEEVVNYLNYVRVVKVENEVLLPTKKTKLYLYKTSMIPASREIQVVDVSSGRRVGVLDEEYVVVYLNPDDVIILAGRPWKIISYDDKESKLYVEVAKTPIEDFIVPHWEGENIPVEYSVAQDVGRMIKYIKETGNIPQYFKNLFDMEMPIKFEKALLDLGDHANIYVDLVKEYKTIVINVYGGSKVNSLIRDLLKHLLKNNYPYLKIRVHSTPYTILIQLSDAAIYEPGKSPVEFVYNVIKNLHMYADRSLIKKVAEDSSVYLWRIYQVAQRFGAISPETTINKRLLEAFVDTIIGKEALREVLFKDYDIASFQLLASEISNGKTEVKLRIYDKLQEHHLLLLGYIEIPQLKDIMVIDTSSFLERLLNRRITLLCLRCGYHREDRVREILKLEKYSCPKCGLATLTLVKGDASEELEVVRKLIRGEKLSLEEQKLHRDLVERAILLYRYRDKAVLSLSTLGVGTQEAVRIINSILIGSDIIYELYEYEKRFLKIKKYLKDKK